LEEDNSVSEQKEVRLYIDAIYILNYVVNKEISKKKGKILAFFVDLKMTFDRIDKIKLGEMLRKTEMREQLRRKIMETYKETKSIIKIRNRKGIKLNVFLIVLNEN